MKDFLGVVFGLIFVVVVVGGAAYFKWWRCGEMFPHAQLACFVGGR